MIAMISGILGQDASYLAELLLSEDYKVVGFHRHTANPNYSNISDIIDSPNFILENGDICDASSVSTLVKKYRPDVFFNTAAQSSVGLSWSEPVATCNINFMGVINCLEAIRQISPTTKFIQCSSSERYGNNGLAVQKEDSPCNPTSPYAVAKVAAENAIKMYRESYNLFACYAISFNHESVRRSKEFVTRKITSWVADAICKAQKIGGSSEEQSLYLALAYGSIQRLRLGNVDIKRDWSHAEDIVRGLYLMSLKDKPDDFIFASGRSHSLNEFISTAFKTVHVKNWNGLVDIDENLIRPSDIDEVCGDFSKAKEELGWEPSYSFEDIIRQLVYYDIK